MGVLLQGFFKVPPNSAVPSPADGTPRAQWWWDHIAAQAKAFSLAGFSAIWLPPMLKTSSGAGPGADGYGPFDDYDIGSKKQKGSIPTRFGTREQLQRCAAILRANGLDIYLDMVEHQRVGDGLSRQRRSCFDIWELTGRQARAASQRIQTILLLRFRAIQILAVPHRTICPLAGSWRRSTRNRHTLCSMGSSTLPTG